MIIYKTGDIFTENVQAIVNTVNCVGIMGRGIALQSKKIFPENFKAYVIACKRTQIHPGKMFVYETNQTLNPRFIINFPTKRHWRSKSQIQDIEKGLRTLIKEIRDRNIKSIAIPPLGSGLGGLKWSEVRKLIDGAFHDLVGVKVIVFEPNSKILKSLPSERMDCISKMTSGRAALVSLISSYLNGLMDPFITLLEIHKLMYFMQETGEPLRLKFKKASYGPYAENLRHVLSNIEGYLIMGYLDGGDQPHKKLELISEALQTAINFLETNNTPATKTNLEKVIDLVDGFETPFGLELLATVHWIAKKEDTHSINEVIRKVYAWSPNKKQFSERQITIAYKTLQEKAWIN